MKTALKMALEALEDRVSLMKWQLARDAVKEALAQPPVPYVVEPRTAQPKEPEQEPVAWMYPDALCDKACLYLCTKGFTQFPECANTPPQRTWVGLTDEQKHQLNQSLNLQGRFPIIDAIEAICKGNNT